MGEIGFILYARSCIVLELMDNNLGTSLAFVYRRIMRSEQEILELIVDTARKDERIRAVIMNGSRVNPNAPRDFFQDYDVVYFVTDVAPFKNNYDWIKRFGELMIMQLPDDMDDPPPGNNDGFALSHAVHRWQPD